MNGFYFEAFSGQEKSKNIVSGRDDPMQSCDRSVSDI